MSGRVKKLSAVLAGVSVCQIDGDPDTVISGVQYDSRRVSPGDAFLAVSGLKVDGKRFVAEATQRGAVVAFVGEPMPRGGLKALVHLERPRTALAQIAANFFDHSSLKMQLVGVTGTKGKTTQTYLLEEVFRAAGGTPGVIGTITTRYPGFCEESAHTTPEAPDLQALFFNMHQAGVTHVAMEVSSHALDLERVRGCHFKVAAFTNLTRDHLDYHGDLDHYAASKALLFSRELADSRADGKCAVVNHDDPRSAEMVKAWSGPQLSYGLASTADVHPIAAPVQELDGIRTKVRFPGGEFVVHSHLPGGHNLYNILTTVAIGRALNLAPEALAAGIAACRSVPGRLERVDGGDGPVVFVDYAHTDQALVSVLDTLRPLTKGRLLVVFGCGGDRDRGKRPLMGAAVARLADLAIVTSDNPRSEDPLAILAEIVPGLRQQGWCEVEIDALTLQKHGAFTRMVDRREAIKRVVQIADTSDVVLIAGKGHENYQIIGDAKIPFDDREEVRVALAARLHDRGASR
jgi:UDP-N-acetylmuramoyl-L-alanyl-D-glutamate--2,6-diaminopimelate ligase